MNGIPGNSSATSQNVPSSMTSSSLLARANAAKAQLMCSNCNRCGHIKDDCFWQGGGKEGQFPPWWNRRGGGSSKGGSGNRDNPGIASANATKTFAMMARVDNEQEVRTFLDLDATHYCFRNKTNFSAYVDWNQNRVNQQWREAHSL